MDLNLTLDDEVGALAIEAQGSVEALLEHLEVHIFRMIEEHVRIREQSKIEEARLQVEEAVREVGNLRARAKHSSELPSNVVIDWAGDQWQNVSGRPLHSAANPEAYPEGWARLPNKNKG